MTGVYIVLIVGALLIVAGGVVGVWLDDENDR